MCLQPTVQPLIKALEERRFGLAGEITDQGGVFFAHYGIRRVPTAVSIGLDVISDTEIDLRITLRHGMGEMQLSPYEKMQAEDSVMMFREVILPSILDNLDYFLVGTGVSDYYPKKTE